VEDVRTALNSERVVDVKLNGLCSSFSGDAELLQLIIMNLVSNAVKYSPPSTPVTALFDCQPDYLIITIIDQGIGISAEDQERLFTLFFRGSNVGEIPGMGLGMVVVKQAVDAHHGEIQLDSQQGVGTRFVVKLPHLTAPVGSELDIEKM
jgi:signal transduction histidine kinase